VTFHIQYIGSLYEVVYFIPNTAYTKFLLYKILPHHVNNYLKLPLVSHFLQCWKNKQHLNIDNIFDHCVSPIDHVKCNFGFPAMAFCPHLNPICMKQQCWHFSKVACFITALKSLIIYPHNSNCFNPLKNLWSFSVSLVFNWAVNFLPKSQRIFKVIKVYDCIQLTFILKSNLT
jgi:hypothetical protein